ncbi:MFS transporter [Streptomyces meridianus]|uniref:MFS transporter n=1 Tax=Streptomyces meridianus TaxID=2938945 RepID=A0ABT0X8U0_9ACTN|nr:MFS transporter [Streptomyces meridianus]MCM2578950.1 MFS transporter [Streptomyces meridianus]
MTSAPLRAGRVGRPFLYLVVGNAVSSYGSFLNMVALNLFALQTTGSALSVGIFLLLRIGSSFLAGFAAGRLVGRFNRKHLMIGGDFTQALALLGFALSPDSAREVLLYGLAAVMGACSTLSGVALRSSVPEIVGQDLRVRANGLLVTGRSLAMVFGFASAGVVVAWAGYTAAFVLDAGTFLVSAATLALLPLTASGRRVSGPQEAGRDAHTGAENGEVRAASGRFAARVWLTGLRRYAPVVLCLVAVRAVDNLGSASHQVGLPVYAAQIDEDTAAAFVGRFWSAWAVGCLIAHQLVSRVPLLNRWAGGRDGRGGGERAFAVGTCLMSGFFIVAFSGLPTAALIVVAAGAGLADGFTQIVYDSRLQALPDDQRGRLLGTAAMAETAALGIGTVLCATLLDRLAPFTVVALAHGTAIVLALGFLLLLVTVPALARTSPGRDASGPPVGAPAQETAASRTSPG